MNLIVQTIGFIFLAAVSTLVAEESWNLIEMESPIKDSDGFGYEIIQSKLDMLEFRFIELFVQLKEQGEAFLNNQRRVEDEQRKLNQIVDRNERKIGSLMADLEDSVGINITHISDQSRKILELQTICSNHDSIRSQLLQMHPKIKNVKSVCQSTKLRACTESGGQMSGLCQMKIGQEETLVYREQIRFGGNWVVILQRYDGSVPFNRSWAEYRDGFGTVGKEFWIGLERLHLLTTSSTYELLVELENFQGNYTYARYDRILVGSENEGYRLSELGEHDGTASDTLTYHVGMTFEVHGSSACSASAGDGGGWFHKTFEPYDCYMANIMGIWQDNARLDSINWLTIEDDLNPLKFIRMMVRDIKYAH